MKRILPMIAAFVLSAMTFNVAAESLDELRAKEQQMATELMTLQAKLQAVRFGIMLQENDLEREMESGDVKMRGGSYHCASACRNWRQACVERSGSSVNQCWGNYHACMARC